MPGVSGELKLQALPMRGGLAKLPGEVPCFSVEGLFPSVGSCKKFLFDMDRSSRRLGELRLRMALRRFSSLLYPPSVCFESLAVGGWCVRLKGSSCCNGVLHLAFLF